MRPSIWILFLSIHLLSCGNRNTASVENETTDTLLTKEISFPPSLRRMQGGTFTDIASLEHDIQGKNKIVQIVDGSCMKCIINQLNKVDSTFANIMSDDDRMIFVLNVSKFDSINFMLNLQPAITARGILLWDNNYNFEKANRLFTADDNLRTFLTNRNNRIVQYGNPLFHSDLLSEYQHRLAQ